MMFSLFAIALLAAPQRLLIGIDAVDLRLSSDAERADNLIKELAATEVRRLPFALVVDVDDITQAGVKLRRHFDVLWMEEEQSIEVQLKAVPDDTYYGEQWTLHTSSVALSDTHINAEAAWDQSLGENGGVGVKVAVVDDGFATQHEDLQGRFFLPGSNFVGVPNNHDVSPGSFDNHGTKVAGVIAANGFNGMGIIGVCPRCLIYPVRLTSSSNFSEILRIDSSLAAQAIDDAVNSGAAVINNSWGPPDGNPKDPAAGRGTYPIPTALALALQHAVSAGRNPTGIDAKGCVVTWSAGNGNELVSYDGFASLPSVVTVGAIGPDGKRAWYSDYGPPLLLMAPSGGATSGPQIWSTDRPGSVGSDLGDYTPNFGGTSSAAAMVAGVAALVVAAYPELYAAQVIEAMLLGAYPIDPQRAAYNSGGKSSTYGYGRVDAMGALLAAANYSDGCTFFFELCDNSRDDDCDGEVDNDPRCNPCIPDAPREQCDGHDNNCDGRIDEDFACEFSERPVCAPCNQSSECAAGLFCRAVDDFYGKHCLYTCLNGESCAPGFHCEDGVCALELSNEVADCADYLNGYQPEVCDGIDNDQNGVSDDVLAASGNLSQAHQACGNAGVCGDTLPLCVDGAWLCQRPVSYQEQESRCDGLDNDCDGRIDEDLDCDGGCAAVPPTPFYLAIGAAFALRKRRRQV